MMKSRTISSIKVLAILPALIPSSIILVVEPLIHLAKLEKVSLRVRLENMYVHPSDLEWADIIVFCRNTDPAFDSNLEHALVVHKPYIYEIDDNFFELPLEVHGGTYHRGPEQIAQLEKYIKHASLVRVYSLSMETRVKRYTSKVKLVKAPVNLSSIPSIPPQRTSQKLKLVYTTSRTIGDDLSQILVKDLARILNEYGDSIEIHFRGYVPKQLEHLPSVKFHRFILNYQKYMQTMYQQGYDIGLAPMKNGIFYRSKTNNKFREFGACWIAGIYSTSEVYANCVEHGKTGLLVLNKGGEWYQAMRTLILDADLRRSIQNNTREIIEREYSLDNFASLLWDHINWVLQEPLISAESTIDPTQIKNFTDKPQLIILRIRKIHGSVKEFGYILTIKHMLQGFERYIEYFALLWRIKEL
jgi:glycosyltransferase involved in cell wall biosynthesis